jgi:hypothetical protein
MARDPKQLTLHELLDWSSDVDRRLNAHPDPADFPALICERKLVRGELEFRAALDRHEREHPVPRVIR